MLFRSSPTSGSGRRPMLRRGLTVAVVGLLATGLLAACSSAPAVETVPAASASETIDFSFAGYETTLLANPERVVVLDSRSGLEFALLADYPLVATAYNADSPLAPLVGEDVKHLKNSAFELDREEIAAHRPDLIVVGAAWGALYEDEGLELDKIAPVLAVNDSIDTEAGAEAGEDTFAAMTEQLTLLGRAEQAADAIAEYERTLADGQKRIGSYATGKTASVLHATVDNYTVITDEPIFRVVLPGLGFTLLDNEEIRSAPVHPSGINHVLSYESATSALADADALLVFKAEDDLEFDPVLKRVPAIESGHWMTGNLAQRHGFALTYTSFVTSVVEAVEGFSDFS